MINKKEMQVVTIYCPKPLYAAAKAMAARQNRSVSNYIVTVLQAELDMRRLPSIAPPSR